MKITTVELTVQFPIAGLIPSALRQRFISSLRIQIARGRRAGALDPAIAEELWRALPSWDRRR